MAKLPIFLSSLSLSGGGKKEEEEGGDLIRLGVVPHEGVRSTGPFSFAPDQCVIPARGSCKVTLTFNPQFGIGKCDGDFHSFALAYQVRRISKDFVSFKFEIFVLN